MIVLENKFLSILLNIFLSVWQIIQIIVGLIGLAIFRSYEVYYNQDAKIKVLRVNKGNLFGSACFSSGPIIFTTPNCSDDTIRHETGHSVQSLYMGPLFHIIVSVPSVIRFWIRRLFNKSHEWYLRGFPEGGGKFGAEELGHSKRSKK